MWQKKTGVVTRKLVRFELQERGIPRHGYEIADGNGNIIGHVTSGIMLPSTKIGIGMGYVHVGQAQPDNIIYIKIREKAIPAKIVK